MSNLLKFTGRCIGLVSEWILILFILFLFFIRTSTFQTYLANQYAKHLSKELQAEVSISKIDINFFSSIELKGLEIKDQKNNLLLAVPVAKVEVDAFSIFNNQYELDVFELSNGKINIYRSEDEDNYNYQFLVDYFSSETDKSSQSKFSCKKIKLNNMSLTYCDEKGLLIQEYARFSKFDFTKMDLDLTNFSSDDNGLSFQVNKMKFFEQEKDIRSNASFLVFIGEHDVKIQNANIQLNKSEIIASYITISKKSDEFLLRSQIDKSFIDLSDGKKFIDDYNVSDYISFKGFCEVSSKSIDFKDFHLDLNGNSLNGDLSIIDYETIDELKIDTKIRTCHIDYPKLKNTLYSLDSTLNLDLDGLNERALVFDLENLAYGGTWNNGVISIDRLKNKNGYLTIRPIETKYDLLSGDFTLNTGQKQWAIIDNFDIGSISNTQGIGPLNATISSNYISFRDFSDFQIENLKVDVQRLKLDSYIYSDFEFISSNFNPTNSTFKLSSNDPNLNFRLNAEFNKKRSVGYDLTFSASFKSVNPGRLGFVENDSIYLKSLVNGNLSFEKTLLTKAAIDLPSLFISNGFNNFELNSSSIEYSKKQSKDHLEIESEIVKIEFDGNIDKNVFNNFSNDLSALYPIANTRGHKQKNHSTRNHLFDLHLTSKSNLNEFLTLFFKDINIANNSTISAFYSSQDQNIKLESNSEIIRIGNLELLNFKMNQSIQANNLNGKVEVKKLILDSLFFDDVVLENKGINRNLNSTISWNIDGHDNSSIKWNLLVFSDNLYNISIEPSFFTLNDYRWEIVDSCQINSITNNTFIDSLIFKRNDQEVIIDGCISDNKFDHLTLILERIDLGEISHIVGSKYKFQGNLSSHSKLNDLFGEFTMNTNGTIDELFIDSTEVGQVFLYPNYSQKTNMVNFIGSLNFKGIKTFNFDGDYSLDTKSLNTKLNFDNTDINVANVFLDEEIIKDLSGKLNGEILVEGSIEHPILRGTLSLVNGNVHIPLTNLSYAIDAKIGVDEDIIFVNNAPIYDEDGNKANFFATVFHSNYSDFNFDVQVLFESPKEDYRFKVLNTQYKDGEYYFGRAYAKGYFDISGDEDLIRIELNAESKKGTEIVFPLYGAEEYEEDEDFIKYISNNIDSTVEKVESDTYSGLDMEFNFSVNKEAKMKLVFDETTGDQLVARGNGEITLKIDPMDNVNMLGRYDITEGSKYDFAIGSFKQPFAIEPGSSINWNGDVTDAELDVKASMALRRVSLLELSPEQIDRSLANQDVICSLTLKDNLLQPTIEFNIDAPKSPESGKALIRKVNADPDELNKQFFSLLLVKKFQPLKGSITANGSAALDVLETQINDLLGKISGKYKLNVDYGRDDIINETSATLGLKTGFFNDRLLISGTFGVDGIGSESNENTSSDFSSSIIGDVQIEYLINEKGTFRLNAFNESSTNSDDALNVDNTTGTYTQGVGISYHEEFHNWKDFKLIQYTLDVFRKEKRYWKKNKKERKKVSVKD